MNKLEEFFYKKKDKKRRCHKWKHYFEVYDRHFKKYIGKNPNIVEIGLGEGGSLEMWNHYFDGKCNLYGIDINQKCKDYEKDSKNIKVFIGDQADKEFWKKFKQQVPKIDILIDDGGHLMAQQIITFEELYDHINDNGTYLCEDLHTSYWEVYGAGLKKPHTFIEYTKNLIDKLNSWHYNKNDLSFRKKTNSIHYYDSIIVIEKKKDENAPTAVLL